MHNLKMICICFCLLFIAEGLSGIYGVHWSYHAGPGSAPVSSLVLDKGNRLSTAISSVVNILIFAGAASGIDRRVAIVWNLGWGVLAYSALAFLIPALSFSVKLPQGQRWILSPILVLVGLGTTAYWGLWWKRQRAYFYGRPTAP
jgi:hypothetical protein